MVIKGSSQWIVGRNVTKHCKITRCNGNNLELPALSDSGQKMLISIVDYDLHSYVPLSAFGIISCSTKVYCAVNYFAAKATERSWSEIKAIVDKVHKHVCGHAAVRGMMILLERNGIWSDNVKSYFLQMVEICPKCKMTEGPKGMRKVSLDDLSSFFIDRVCPDHVFLDKHVVLHFMDSSTRLSHSAIVETRTVKEAINLFEMFWVSQNGYPHSLIAEQAFVTDDSQKIADSVGMKLLRVPSRCHHKNVLESKH